MYEGGKSCIDNINQSCNKRNKMVSKSRVGGMFDEICMYGCYSVCLDKSHYHKCMYVHI